MFKDKYSKALLLIFVFALAIRLFKLETFPYGFHNDEARVAWNAVSILKTGKDDKGNILPLYYDTFGDHRLTGIIYSVIPSILIFGKTEFAVRFPSALVGALTIIPIYLFVVEITKNKKLGTLSSILLSISPWHIDVSRATSETIMASFLTLSALYFFIHAIKQKETKKKSYIISLVLVLISYLFYHSTRILTPLYFGIIAFYFWKTTKNKKVKKLIRITLTSVVALTVLFSINPEARGRLTQVSVFGDIDVKYEISVAKDIFNNKYVIYTKRILGEYVKYFSPDFLIGYEARPYRYITPGIGILTFAEAVLLILGIIQIIKKKESPIPLILLLASPVPAALTTEDSPNLMRSFYMVLFIVIISGYGLKSLLETRKQKKLIKNITFGLIFLNFIFFLNMYFNHSYIHRPLFFDVDMDNSSYRNIGNKELALKLDNVKGNYEKVIVTGDPDNIYPWYAFFTNKDPKEFNKNTRQFENIYFSDTRCPSDNSFKENTGNILVVDMWQCSPETKIKDGAQMKILEKTYRPDKSNIFTLITRGN